MNDSFEVLRSASVIPVPDVAETVAFYHDVLGFEVELLGREGVQEILAGFVRRGGTTLMFTRNPDPQALNATGTYMAVYVWVRGLDAFFAALEPKLKDHPKCRLRPPFDQPFGVREFHLRDPNGLQLYFAQIPEEA